MRHTQHSTHVLNIAWKVGLRVRAGELLTCEHTGAPYVSEDTRVRFTEQISGHCSPDDPGTYRGHLDQNADGWTQPKHTHTRLSTENVTEISGYSTHPQEIKKKCMNARCVSLGSIFFFKSCCENVLDLIFFTNSPEAKKESKVLVANFSSSERKKSL